MWAVTMKIIIEIIINILASTSVPQPSTTILNQSLGKSASTYLNDNDATTYL